MEALLGVISLCFAALLPQRGSLSHGVSALSDSGSVQRTLGQGPQLLEATVKFVLLRAGAEDFQRSLPTPVMLLALHPMGY